MFEPSTLSLVLLLVAVNGAPLLLRMLWKEAPLGTPLDGGRVLADGRPLWGASKTVRGALAMVAVGGILAPLLGISFRIGLLVGLQAMFGDLFSSFLKRRLGVPPGGMALGLDQVPEALFPLLACKFLLGLDWAQIGWIILLFTLADLLLSRLAWLLGYRDHPH